MEVPDVLICQELLVDQTCRVGKWEEVWTKRRITKAKYPLMFERIDPNCRSSIMPSHERALQRTIVVRGIRHLSVLSRQMSSDVATPWDVILPVIGMEVGVRHVVPTSRALLIWPVVVLAAEVFGGERPTLERCVSSFHRCTNMFLVDPLCPLSSGV
jgi:hypothetical protein